MKKTTFIVFLSTIILLAVALVPAIAYFSSKTDIKANHFSIVAGDNNDDLSLIKEEWNDTAAYDLVPGEIRTKKVAVKSCVSYPAYAYVGVTIPQVVASEDAETEADSTDAIKLLNINEGWEEIENTLTDDNNKRFIVYACDETLSPGAQSSDLFTEIQVPDFEVCEGIDGSIDVTGYLVQEECVEKDTADAEAIEYLKSTLITE